MLSLLENFWLASLKTIYFESVDFANDELTNLLSNCPTLKDLTLKKCKDITDFEINSIYLNFENLNIYEEEVGDKYEINDFDSNDHETVFEIFAPKLKRIDFSGRPIRSYYIGNNLNPLVSVDFNFDNPSTFSVFWKTKKTIRYGRFIKNFYHTKILKLSNWCTMVCIN